MSESAGVRRLGRPSWRVLRFVALLVGAAVALTILVLPQSCGVAGPGSGSRSPGPTFNLPAALDAQLDDAGLMRSGGMWVVQGSYLLTSVDHGESWRAGVIPDPADSVFVLDQDHAWATSPVDSGSAGVDSQPFLVDRTRDGGRTWLSGAVPGGFECDSQTFSFLDAARGFLMCWTPGATGTGVAPGKGWGTVLATDDGGASWSIVNQSAGLGSRFTASDATTLWASPDYSSSVTTGVALYVSRDAGRSWSTVDLPELASVPAGAGAAVAAGPVFQDASHGAFAVGVYLNGSGGSPAVWFYGTSDRGSTWTVVKRPRNRPMDPSAANALVGRKWAVVGTDTFGSLSVSSDRGASWTDIPAYGLPSTSPFMWLDFTDQDHCVGWVFAPTGGIPSRVLMQSSDGGHTWHAADFGDARARVSPDLIQDPVAAKRVAVEFASAADKDPATAWRLLSSYSQRAFGSYSDFATAEAALYRRVNHEYEIGEPTQNVKVRNRAGLGSALWDDMSAFANTSRTYVVVVSFPHSSEPPVTLAVAPLAITGDWRVWVVMTP
jgi:hypothetical protein